jgi:hypothetical protein
MKRHQTDVISLVSGLLFAGLGVVFALHALGTFNLDVGVVPAVVLIVLGIAGIAAAVTASPRSGDAAGGATSVSPGSDPGSAPEM